MGKSIAGKISCSNTYRDLITLESPSESGKDTWRCGLVTGNGENGVVETCAPATDVMIFQNMKFAFPTNAIRVTPCMSDVREETVKSIVEYEGEYLSAGGGEHASQLMIDAASDWIQRMNLGKKWTLQHTYAFHPAHQLRIQMDGAVNGEETVYERYTNYQTGEIGTNWIDKNSVSFERKTFTSREDNVNITVIKSVSGEKISLAISVDDIARMSNEGNSVGTDITPLRYRKVVDKENAEYIGISAHYPYYKNSEFNRAGFGGITRIMIKGGRKEYVFGNENSDSYKNPVGGATETEMNIGYDKAPLIKITDADEVYLITKTDIDTDMCTLGEFEECDTNPDYLEKLICDTKAVWDKYGGDSFSYEKALKPSAKIHGEIFNRLTYSVCTDKEDIAMQSYTNEELIEAQKKSRNMLLPAMLERLFYNGRFANVCSSGIQAPRLGGMWTGAWGCQWSGDYTTDANINLQIAGANIGSLGEETEGFINVMLRTVVDWQLNAKQAYGIDDALLASSRTDGYTAVLTHFFEGFPGQMWISGAAWLIFPMYEYYECFGNKKIPLTKDIRSMLLFTGNEYDGYCETVDKYGRVGEYHEFDIRHNKTGEKVIYNLRNVLMLSEERAEEILRDGYFDLKRDILYPLTKKCANFYLGFVNEKYYTKDKKAYFDESHTKMNMGDGWLFAPGYSPENEPMNTNNGFTANAVMDISASRSIMEMAEEFEKEFGGSDKEEVIKAYRYYVEYLPPYLYEDTGELKEWALEDYTERYSHRHGSQLYGLWPLFEAKSDKALFKGAKKLIETKNSIDEGDSRSGHGWLHRSLVMARINDGEGVRDTLLPLVRERMIYPSMMMAHNNDGTAAYCTDSVITIPAIELESLVYTDKKTIELLPALLPEITNGGSLAGCRGVSLRSGGVLESMEWNKDCIKAEIVNSKGLKVKCRKGLHEAFVNGKRVEHIQTDGIGEEYFVLEPDGRVKVEIIF